GMLTSLPAESVMFKGNSLSSELALMTLAASKKPIDSTRDIRCLLLFIFNSSQFQYLNDKYSLMIIRFDVNCYYYLLSLYYFRFFRWRVTGIHTHCTHLHLLCCKKCKGSKRRRDGRPHIKKGLM